MGILKRWLGGSGKRLDIESRFPFRKRIAETPTGIVYEVGDSASIPLGLLKVIDPTRSEALRKRYAGLGWPTETEIAKTLTGEPVLPLVETGETNNGQPYLWFQHTPGIPLATLLRKPDLKLVTRCLFVSSLVQTLNVIHAADHVHRNLNPNVFWANEKTGALHLFDFSTVVPDRSDLLERTSRTTNALHKAPEIVRRKPITRQIDVFSVGVMAFQLLTGAHPWRVREGAGAAALRFDTDEPSQLTELLPDIAPVIARAIHKSLLADPAQRPTARQLAIAIA